jgi:tRNA(Arg) A34 adenosine deaminase TadA
MSLLAVSDHMQMALVEARAAGVRGEVPIGAVITDGRGTVLSRQGNRTRELSDPTAHAEMLAIREACRLMGAQRIDSADLYVTLEPCAMCAAAKGGAVESGPMLFSQPTCHHAPEVYGGMADRQSAELLRDFFRARRG